MPQAFIKDRTMYCGACSVDQVKDGLKKIPNLKQKTLRQAFWPPARVGLLDSAGILLDHLQSYFGLSG